MKAIVCRELRGVAGLAVEEMEAPRPGADEVRIAVHRASINFIDLLIAEGSYQIRPQRPYVAGAEAAGEIVEIGDDVREFTCGDRVATFHLTGAFADEMTAKAHRTIHLPDTVGFSDGAAILHNYVTAAYALMRRGRLVRGESVLVHGASGGVGLAAVDMARHLGARVIASVGGAERARVVGDYGRCDVVDHATESFRDRVKAMTGGSGVDVVFDPIGGDVFEQSLRCIAWDGRLLVIGFVGGRIQAIPANLPLLKSCSIVGVNTGAWPEKDPAAFRALADEVMSWVGEGRLRPLISAEYPLDEFREAIADLTSRTGVGRNILRLR